MEHIWPGSSSFSSGNTPYGFYDSDTHFSGSNAHSVDNFADWAAKRLGYPIVAVELQDVQFDAFGGGNLNSDFSGNGTIGFEDLLTQFEIWPTDSSITNCEYTPVPGSASFIASNIYHNEYWLRFVGRKRIREAMNTGWGKLFKQYQP